MEGAVLSHPWTSCGSHALRGVTPRVVSFFGPRSSAARTKDTGLFTEVRASPIGSEKPDGPEGIQEASFVTQNLHQNRCLRLTDLRGLANLPFSPSGQSAAPKFERAGPSEFLFHPVLFFGARSSAARTKEKARSGPAGIRTPVPGSEGRKDIQTTLQAHEKE